MQLTKYSQNRLMNSLYHWRVARDFADPMFNYLVFGIEPGGFFKGWYANDATSILHSHSTNTVEALRNLTRWMINCAPDPAWGNHDKVNHWLKMSAVDRRFVLEHYELIYTEAEEIEMALKGLPVTDPVFFD
jgi:hypothetical protein